MNTLYEGLFIFPDVLDEEALDLALGRVKEELELLGGAIESTTRMGKKAFARPLKKQKAGLYVVMMFNIDGTKLDVIWPLPTFGNFRPPVPPFGAEQWDSAGTFLIGIWLLIVVGLMVAFLISFFYSGSTVIYYLLRREVDATDIEDVYLQEEEEQEED